MAGQRWRRLGLVWTIGLTAGLCIGCEQRPLGTPVAIMVRRPNSIPAANGRESGDAAATEPAAEQSAPPIFDEEADGKLQIAAAIDQAWLKGTRVLIVWGSNRADWCRKLYDVFMHDELVSPIIAGEYELVLIDAGRNKEAMHGYAAAELPSPLLTIVDGNGRMVANQGTLELQVGDHHDPEKVAAALREWQSPRLDAEKLLWAAVWKAGQEDKRVLVHIGTPSCGWCQILSRFLEDHRAILSRDYIDLRIDTVRMEHGEEVEARLMPEGSQGVPEMAILDASNKVLATSLGSDGNIGFPYQPVEIEHFISMLTETKQRLVDDDLLQIRADLDAYRVEREQRHAAPRD